MTWMKNGIYLSASRTLISALLLLTIFPPGCLAFKAGHYDNEVSSYPMLVKAIGSADRKIEIVEMDKVDIGVCIVKKNGAEYGHNYFARDQLQNFFSNEQHKNLLAVRAWPHDLNAVKAYVLTLGYKRVIIYNYRVTGIQLFYDSDEERSTKSKSHP